jgi:hypothetical protein
MIGTAIFRWSLRLCFWSTSAALLPPTRKGISEGSARMSWIVR